MKTTIDIADALLAEAKAVAVRDGVTLRELVEQGLREALSGRGKPVPLFTLRDASVDGQGLQPGVSEGSWEQLRDLSYEGRGA